MSFLLQNTSKDIWKKVGKQILVISIDLHYMDKESPRRFSKCLYIEKNLLPLCSINAIELMTFPLLAMPYQSHLGFHPSPSVCTQAACNVPNTVHATILTKLQIRLCVSIVFQPFKVGSKAVQTLPAFPAGICT